MDTFDDSLKYLIHHEPEDFLRFGLSRNDLKVVESAPVNLPARSRAVDAIYRIELDAQPMMAHIEFHRRHQRLDELAVDVAEAQVRLYRRERLPVLSFVWDLYGGTRSPLFEERVLHIGPAVETQRPQSAYRRINLRGMSAQEFLATAPASLWPLVPLTRDGATPEAVRTTFARIDQREELPPSRKADHIAVLWFIAEAEHVPVEVLRACVSEEKMQESVLYQEIFAKGRRTGSLDQEAETILRILARRLGQPDTAVLERVRSASSEQLEAWYDQALDVVSPEGAAELVQKILQQ